VKREHHGEKFYPDGSRVWPLYYAVEAWLWSAFWLKAHLCFLSLLALLLL
jgi:hypothetical protein